MKRDLQETMTAAEDEQCRRGKIGPENLYCASPRDDEKTFFGLGVGVYLDAGFFYNSFFGLRG